MLEQIGQLDRAYELLLKMDQEHPGIILAKARTLWKMKRYEEALELFNHQKISTDPKALLSKGRCFVNMGRHQEALKIFRSFNQRDPHVLLAIARCLQEKGGYEELTR